MTDKSQFLAVRHGALNGSTYEVSQLVEDTLGLEKYLPERTITPCFEGDLVQVRETGEVVFTHENFRHFSQQHYQDLRERKLAASLKEVLDRIAVYQQRCSDKKVVLCLEAKTITSEKTINEAIKAVHEYGFIDVYFDSFFGDKLDAVDRANKQQGTMYTKSLHLLGNVGNKKFTATKAKNGYDILTVPHTTSFGNLSEPVIYGAVGSIEILQRMADDPLVFGAYVRLAEGAGIRGAVRKLWNSVRNTERRKQIDLPENK